MGEASMVAVVNKQIRVCADVAAGEDVLIVAYPGADQLIGAAIVTGATNPEVRPVIMLTAKILSTSIIRSPT